MATVTTTEPAATLEQLRAQVAELLKRLETLEAGGGAGMAPASAPPPAAPPAAPAAAPAAAAAAPVEPAAAALTEEEMLAIAAAIGAYLGVRAHIRQIRLVSTSAWAQQGRVSIQASHSLQG